MRKKLFLFGIIISIFILIVSISTLYAQYLIFSGNLCSCTIIPYLIPSISSIGLIIGLIISYFIQSSFQKECINVTSIIFNLLNEDERKILEKIVKEGGEIKQSSLSKEFGKVKAYRLINKLINKGLLEKEKEGKVVKLKIKEEISKFLVEK